MCIPPVPPLYTCLSTDKSPDTPAPLPPASLAPNAAVDRNVTLALHAPKIACHACHLTSCNCFGDQLIITQQFVSMLYEICGAGSRACCMGLLGSALAWSTSTQMVQS